MRSAANLDGRTQYPCRVCVLVDGSGHSNWGLLERCSDGRLDLPLLRRPLPDGWLGWLVLNLALDLDLGLDVRLLVFRL